MVPAGAEHAIVDAPWGAVWTYGPAMNTVVEGIKISVVVWVLRVRWATSITPYRAFRGWLRESVTQRTAPVICLDALLAWGTDRIGAVVVRHEERRVGKSGYSAGRLMRHALMLVTSFSGLPWRLAGGAGTGRRGGHGTAAGDVCGWANFALGSGAGVVDPDSGGRSMHR